eukprot:gene29941-33794_t
MWKQRAWIAPFVEQNTPDKPDVSLTRAKTSATRQWQQAVKAGDANAKWFEYTGIQSTGHGPQSPIHLAASDAGHPLAKGFQPFVTANEELYNNLTQFNVTPVLTGTQPDAKAEAERALRFNVAWTHRYGPKQARVFSTTLAHNEAGMADPRYLDLVARGLLWATGHLRDDGQAEVKPAKAETGKPSARWHCALTIRALDEPEPLHKPTAPTFRLSALSMGVLAMLTSMGVHAQLAESTAVAGVVVITGQQASLRKSIAAQDKADNIISVVSSDDIGGLPDKNAAEALARLPGVSVQRDQGEGRYITVRGWVLWTEVQRVILDF